MADLNNFIGGGSKTVKMRDQRERIRGASEAELRELLVDVQGELLGLRTQAMLHQNTDPMRIRRIRKMVARIHAELSARERKTAGV